ncbi:MoaD/ThiS family protein [Vulcanisaeta thermophila]|uniref:MoaD/ThiS family protein n=1 Tax=Vulcanisaeta thermophila TaxID=867917 RepID=UPI0008538C12|nr:MoaD/ThiS family protein [Vulcanisaeta thermophila]
MKVTIKFLALVYDMVGKLKVDVELPCGSTVSDLIRVIDRTVKPRFSESVINNGRLSEKFLILINGRSIDHLDGLDTRLKDGDEVTILPHCGVA